jgi:hypothetical protein
MEYSQKIVPYTHANGSATAIFVIVDEKDNVIDSTTCALEAQKILAIWRSY